MCIWKRGKGAENSTRNGSRVRVRNPNPVWICFISCKPLRDLLLDAVSCVGLRTRAKGV